VHDRRAPPPNTEGAKKFMLAAVAPLGTLATVRIVCVGLFWVAHDNLTLVPGGAGDVRDILATT
jgi:hypothetical protein